MLRILRLRKARLFLAGQLISLVGDSSLWLAAGIWVKALTGSSGAAGLSFFIFAAAYLTSPALGVLADRMSRVRLLLWSNVAGAVILSPLFAVNRSGQVWIIYLVMFGYGLVGATTNAAQTAYLTDLLPRHLWGEAQALLGSSKQGIKLFAPFVGAGLFALTGGKVVAALDVATFLVAALTVVKTRVPETPRDTPAESVLAAVRAGISHLSQERVIGQILKAAVIVMLVTGFVETAVFSVVTQELHRVPAFVGVLQPALGAGAILGGLTAASAMRLVGEGIVAGIGMIICGAAWVLVLVPSVVVVVAGFLIAGAGLGWVVPAEVTAIQRRTPNRLLGRVKATSDLLLYVPQAVSIGFGALLVGFVGYRALLVCVFVGCAASGLWLVTRAEQHIQLSRGRPRAGILSKTRKRKTRENVTSSRP
jgi:MFS family permease